MDKISKNLLYLGFPPALRGFDYLYHVISSLCSGSSDNIKDACDNVAKEFKVNVRTLSSAIRNSIHAAYNSGRLGHLNDEIGYEVLDLSQCPTNNHLIAVIVQYLSASN